MFRLQCFQCFWLLPVLVSVATSWIIPNIARLDDSLLTLTPFELDDFLNGTFAAKNWNGTWISGKMAFIIFVVLL